MMIKSFTDIPPFLKNKYFIAIVAFSTWMIFFDRDDLVTQFQRFSKLRELNQSSQVLQQQMDDARKELESRRLNPKAYEKLAREKYYMKRENEDVFVFEE
ncbi:MAG: FtsB family cell division protein [Chitinophagaceae bacterium]